MVSLQLQKAGGARCADVNKSMNLVWTNHSDCVSFPHVGMKLRTNGESFKTFVELEWLNHQRIVSYTIEEVWRLLTLSPGKLV